MVEWIDTRAMTEAQEARQRRIKLESLIRKDKEEYKTTLFRIFGSADKEEYKKEVKEFNTVNNDVTTYLKTNGVEISPRNYLFQDTAIFRDDFSEPPSSLMPLMGIELKIAGNEDNVKKASCLLKEKFGFDDFESAGLTWDSIFSCIIDKEK